MKRVLLGLFLTMSICGFVGCAEYEGDKGANMQDECVKDPNLPMCQNNPGNDQPEEPPSTGDDF